MLFLIEFRLTSGDKYQIAELFEARGPNRTPGVKFRNGWIGSRENLIFVLTESNEESLVAQACEFWKTYGDFTIHPVIEAEKF